MELATFAVVISGNPSFKVLKNRVHNPGLPLTAEEQHRESERDGLLIGEAAHDLKTILNQINLGVSLLRSRAGDQESVKTLDFLDAGARRGAAIVKHLLDSVSGHEPNPVRMSVEEVARDVVHYLTASLPRKIALMAEYHPEAPHILGDPIQIGQALLNLCINAWEAMPEGGTLTICLEGITLDSEAAARIPGAHAGHYARLSVSDTGRGMDPELLGRIFEPFFTTKAAGAGHGLGLATVQRVVRTHSGAIRVSSEKGSGSQFELYLPAASEGS